jgi:carnitine 3-dehydrogenase
MSNYTPPENICSVAVIGTGSVGASWAALFLAHGIDVVAYDSANKAEARTRTFIKDAWPALIAIGAAELPNPPFDRMRFVASPEEAAKAADVVQENVPENPSLKTKILTAVDGAASQSKLILSSTGGIPPTVLQKACKHPERFVVVHPFNPTHLMPLVEIVGGEKTSAQVIDWAMAFARRVGKEPIKLNIEANGHMTNRLQFALVREAVACLIDGIASAQDIDKAVRYGLAPRWALMGSLLTLHLAGGPGGMQGILDHAGRAIEEWWTPRSFPNLDSKVKERLVEAAAEISAGASIEHWTRWRDAHLVDVIRLQNSSAAEPTQRAS